MPSCSQTKPHMYFAGSHPVVLIEIVVNIYKQGDLHKSRGTCFFLFFLEKSKEVTVTLGSLSWVVTLELS